MPGKGPMSDFLKIYEKFKTVSAERGLIAEDDAVLAAVSGGRDSTAMLLLLAKLREEREDLFISVFHYNHCLRGEESNGDERFVKGLAEKLRVDYFSGRGDVAKYAADNKLSVETAARELRYSALRDCAAGIEKWLGKKVKIAVAHTAEDRAETVFLNIVRGSSVEGLEGIKYVNGDIIRPILDLTKDEVETVCAELGQDYRTDSTNFERIGKRNVLRLDVFPYIDKKMDCDTKERLLSLSKLAATDADYLAKETDRVYSDCTKACENGDVELLPEKICALHPAIRSRVLRKAISLTGDGKGFFPYRDCVSFGSEPLERLTAWLGCGKGTLELGKGTFCVSKGDRYFLTLRPGKKVPGTNPLPVEISLPSAGTANVPLGDGGSLEIRIAPGKEQLKIALEQATASGENEAVFDLDVLLETMSKRGGQLLLRAPEEGDRIRPIGASGGKSLGKFLTDKKIGPADRSSVRLIALGKDVVHVFEVRRSDIAPVTEETVNGVIFALKKAETEI